MFLVYAREALGELTLNCPTKVTLPKLLRINQVLFSSLMASIFAEWIQQCFPNSVYFWLPKMTRNTGPHSLTDDLCYRWGLNWALRARFPKALKKHPLGTFRPRPLGKACKWRQESQDLSVNSGMARVRLADLNGPKWTKIGQNGPKWTILVHFGLANAKIQFGIRPFRPKWSFGPLWTILVQYTFRQYRGHSL